MENKLLIGIDGIEIKEVTEEFMSKLMSTSNSKTNYKYSPIGLFYLQKGLIVAVDNSTGDAWTEQFYKFDDAIKWLSGEIEHDSLTHEYDPNNRKVNDEVLHDGFVWTISQIITFLGNNKKIYRLRRFDRANVKKEIILDVSEKDLGVVKPKIHKVKKPNRNISIYDLLGEVAS